MTNDANVTVARDRLADIEDRLADFGFHAVVAQSARNADAVARYKLE